MVDTVRLMKRGASGSLRMPSFVRPVALLPFVFAFVTLVADVLPPLGTVIWLVAFHLFRPDRIRWQVFPNTARVYLCKCCAEADDSYCHYDGVFFILQRWEVKPHKVSKHLKKY